MNIYFKKRIIVKETELKINKDNYQK